MTPAGITQACRLSSAQSAIWFAQALDPASPAFNIAEYVDIRGPLAPRLFASAVRQVVREVDALRLRVTPHAQQYLADCSGWILPTLDFSLHPDPFSAAMAWMQDDLSHPVQPDREPLFRYALLQLSSERFFWYVRYHHLSMDGHGGALVAQRVAQVYSALAEGHDAPPAALGSCLNPLNEAEEEKYRNTQLARDRAYWLAVMADRPDVATLSVHPPAKMPSHGFIRRSSSLPAPLMVSLSATGSRHGCSLAQVFEAAAALYLHRFTGADDVVLGVPVTARLGRRLRGIPGMMSNVLPLRLRFDPFMSFAGLLEQAARRKPELLRHQRYRAEDLRHDLGLQPADPDVYGLMVNVMPFNYRLEFFGCAGTTHNLSNGPVDDLSIVLYDRQDGSDPRLDFDANPLRYTRDELALHQQRFIALLRQLASPDLPLHAFTLPLPEEARAIIDGVSAPDRDCAHGTLPQLLEAQAAQTPGATALVFGNIELSYAELHERANRLARILAAMGAGPESLIGICLPRAEEMLVALLGILKAGSAYLPLDPEYPQARLAGILEDAAALCVLTSSSLRSLLPRHAKTLALDAPEIRQALAHAPNHNLTDADRIAPLLPRHPAYVIYTSGSTGKPKGVMIEHRSAAVFIAWAGSVFTRDDWAGVLASTSISFDLSVFELFATLSHGGTVLLAGSALELPMLAARDRVRLINTVPSAARSLLDSAGLPASVRTVNLAGEALPKTLVEDLYLHGHIQRVFNLYGPSEDTTYSTFALCPPGDHLGNCDAPPIGLPISNTRAYVLDRYLQPLPAGAIGELYLSGAGLARGYLNHPGLTAGRFVADPFSPGARMYRTGDLARLRSDGALDFLGRADHQVKIRGFRIEPEEIEAVIREHPGIRQAVVVPQSNGSAGKQLVAYVVLESLVSESSSENQVFQSSVLRERAAQNGHSSQNGGASLDCSDFDWTALRRSLAQRLPRHMLPAAYVLLAALPLTPNGKLDRRALPAPAWPGASPELPRNPREELLHGLFCEVLSRDQVGIHDSFFELGGHSLMAMQLLSRIRVAVGIDLPVRAVFDAPTVALLATQLDGSGEIGLRPDAQPRPDCLPLSFGQLRLWFLDQLQGGSTQFHIPAALRLRGELDLKALERAANAIVSRHESLRARFVRIEDEPRQVIATESALSIPLVDLGAFDPARQRAEVENALRREWDEPFDLARGPLLRLKVLRLSPREHVLVRAFHHIIADGWSEDIFNRELAAFYSAFRNGKAPSLPALSAQYGDYVLWQRGPENESRRSAALEYWKNQLDGIPDQLDLPRDRPRPARQTFAGKVLRISLPPEQLATLEALSRQNGCTLYMSMLAAFALLLHRYSGQDDIVIGSPVANRPDARLEPLIGFFSSAAVMRLRLDDNAGFTALLQQARAIALDAYRHQDVPFEHLAHPASAPRALNYPAIFQVMFALQNIPAGEHALAGLHAEALADPEPRVRFDLELYAWKKDGRLDLCWVYNRDLYDSWRMEQMARHFNRLLASLTAQPAVPLYRVEMISPGERRRLLEEWNHTAAAYPPDALIHALIEQQAALAPQAVAAEFGGRQLTHGELALRSDQLARHLRTLGVAPNLPVAVCMERGFDLLVALLGILKAGSAYVPLDPAYPPARLRYMLDDSGAAILLTQNALRSLLPAHHARLIALDLEWPAIAAQPARGPAIHVHARDLAYIIYTSGSTGRPKGVAVEHRQVCNQLFWARQALSLNGRDCVLQKASFSFDASILEIFLPLAAGARIAIAAPGDERDVDRLLAFALEKSVSYVDLAPSLLAALLDHTSIAQWSSLRVMSSGAETLQPELAALFHRKLSAELWNTYGPTETTVQSTWRRCLPSDVIAPIGKPIANTSVYVLDDYLRPLPAGVAGELYIGGEGVARGYWKRPAFTAEKFIADPFASTPGARMYRTGDMARWLSDGNLEFLGRADHQIKIRGYRIELGEIESALRSHPDVAGAIVAIHERESIRQLCAYVVSSRDHGSLAAELRRQLSQSLPEYMVPSRIMVLDAWPLMPNGKIDRRALPLPALPGPEHMAARTPEEEVLCSLFAGVLQLERVGRDDNFFDLGGHSLLATRLVARVRQVLGRELAIRTLFEAPTVGELAQRLRLQEDQSGQAGRPALAARPRPERLPLSYAQQRLWFLYRMEGPSPTYNIPLAVRLEGRLEQNALEQALNDVIARHEALRTVFPEDEGLPCQKVLGGEQARLRLSVESIGEAALQARLSHAAATGIELERELPLRAWLFRITATATDSTTESATHDAADGTYVFLLVLHHIAGDGWSVERLARDVEQAYQARLEGHAPGFAPLPIQYGDYTLWQRELLGEAEDPGSLLSQQLAFWSSALAGMPEELPLPVDRPRPATMTYCGATVELSLDAGLHRGLLGLARQSGASLFMVLEAGLAALLSRLGAGQDIPIGTVVAERGQAELEELVGFFVNTLVLRADLAGDPSFTELIERVRRFALDAYAHQDVPFERLVEALEPARSQSRHPLFQVALVLQNISRPRASMPGLVSTQIPVINPISRFDLLFTCTEQLDSAGRPRGIHCAIEYSADLFDRPTVTALGERYARLLEQAAAAPERPLHRLEILSAAERRLVLEDFNSTLHPVPSVCLPELLAAQAVRTPEQDAVVFAGQQLTYAMLHARANRLARYLIGKGIGPECLVGIALERSLEMVIAILATLKSGAAYLPLDPDYPPARLEHMMNDAAPRVALTSKGLRARLPLTGSCELLSLDDPDFLQALAALPDHELAAHERTAPLLPHHPAYAIYTSGSTGAPKGAVNTHRGIVNRMLWMQAQYCLVSDDRVLQKTPFSFDVSVWEFLWPLLQGATLVMAMPGGHRDPAYLAPLIQQQRITTVHFVPSMLSAFLEEPQAAACRGLRRVICSGEALTSDLQARFFRILNVPLHNLYGPTEAAVDVSFWECRPEAGPAGVPIGHPIWNTRMYVLDHALSPAPVGVAGELYLAGMGLARGYLGRPSLTSEKFIANPFGPPGSRMYRTGDMARWRADGALDFLGRADQQVKIRGLRIELGEIESRLRSHPAVLDAAVIVRDNGPAGKQLVAYYTAVDGIRPDDSSLHGHLGVALPEYMVPAAFVCLEHLPLGPNGKLDRKALPAPERTSGSYTAPQDPRQQILCSIFAELLPVERVGIDDSFFRLGGDSILSLQLVSRAKKSGIFFTPRDVFQSQTPRALALAAHSAMPDALPGHSLEETGPLTPTPIMCALFELGGPFKQFHQSMLLDIPAAIGEQALLRSLQLLLETHAVLRLRMDAGALTVPPADTARAEECLTLLDSSNPGPIEQVTAAAVRLLDPQASRLLRAVWMKRENRLLLLIHHLAVDGLSWRILTSDLESAWRALMRGEEPALEPVPVSFRLWTESLRKSARSQSVRSQLPFWKQTLAEDGQLLPGAVLDSALDTISGSRNLRLSLPPSLVSALLASVVSGLHAPVLDVLLAGLAIALLDWRRHSSPGPYLLLDLEGHGREPLENYGDMDLSRTVGWFTSIFPMRLKLENLDLNKALAGGDAAGDALRSVRDQLRAIPGHGLGYGLLRYFDEEGKALASYARPQLVFNYLGRFSADGGSGAAAETRFGGGADPQMPLQHLLSIDALLSESPDGPRLVANFNWAASHLTEAGVRQIADAWKRALEAFIIYARQRRPRRHSLSDFPLVALSPRQIEELESACPGLIDIWQLSPLQQGLLFHSLYAGAAGVYTVQTSLEFSGELNTERLRQSLEILLERYPNLRVSVYHHGLEQPVQVAPAGVHLPWREVDLTGTALEARERRCARLIAEEKARGFQFSAGPLLRFVLVRLALERHLLVFTHHHLILDGWSIPIFIGEMLALYSNGLDRSALPQARPYSDYLAWLANQDQSSALASWKNYLAGLESPTLLASPSEERDDVPMQQSWQRDLTPELTQSLHAMARSRRLTLNTVLQGAWAVLLARMANQDDVVFGITASGRSAEVPGIERMVGLFINTVPLRARLNPEEPFATMLARLQDAQAQMLAAYHVGLSEIQREAGFERLFDSLFVFENYPLDRSVLARSFAGACITHVEMKDGAHYPLALMAAPGEQQLRIRLDYAPAQFSGAEAGAMAERFIRLLQAASARPESPWFQLDFLSDAERKQLLEEFNPDGPVLPQVTVKQILEEQAARHAGSTAVTQGTRSLTYGELNLQANRLAHYLISRGAGPESLVGIALDRSPEMIIAIVATWKAGAAYLPLDPGYPSARLEHMMKDAAPVLALTSTSLHTRLPFTPDVEAILLDTPEIASALANAPTHNPARAVLPLHPAYVIYTSGSTGVPKAVVITHSGISSLAAAQDEHFRLAPGSRVLQFASFNFDASFWELLMTLGHGATLVLPQDEREGALLYDLILSQGVTHALLPIPVLRTLEQFATLPLRFLMNGGEALSGELVERWSHGLNMVNLYGPTETTVCATMSGPLSGASVPPIGSPIANTRIYLLDHNLELVPAGVAGEIYISGAGLGRGYLKRPALTAERFVADPYSASGARMYRTGDLARWRMDGALEFIGRADGQVKVRGFRIELGEIEASLCLLPEIAEAAVMVREEAASGKQIIAYIVPKNGNLPDTAVLRRRLNDSLPAYMLPAAFVPLEKFPLAPNGKLDRRALSTIAPNARPARSPQSPEELALCAMFAEVLALKQVSVEDDFFALGGDSLSAMRLLGRISAAFGVALTPRDFYSASTVAGLATLVQAVQFAARAGKPPVNAELFEEEEI